MITTDTITEVCMEEEFFVKNRTRRISALENILEERDLYMLESEFGDFFKEGENSSIPELFQLACEAIKWHHIRQDGVNIMTALKMMGCAS